MFNESTTQLELLIKQSLRLYSVNGPLLQLTDLLADTLAHCSLWMAMNDDYNSLTVTQS